MMAMASPARTTNSSRPWQEIGLTPSRCGWTRKRHRPNRTAPRPGKPLWMGVSSSPTIAGNSRCPGPDGKMMDMNFTGMAIEGYDNVKKKFVFFVDR